MRVSLARAGIRQGCFSNHHIKGIAKYQISSYESHAFLVRLQFDSVNFTNLFLGASQWRLSGPFDASLHRIVVQVGSR